MAANRKDKLAHYECEGQMSLFDFIPEPKPREKLLPCDTCGHDIQGCCDYDYVKNHDYCVLGSKWIPKEAPICKHSGHSCNKKNLWEVADTLDELQCPHVCCRKCNTRNCGARCNGSEEPKRSTRIGPDDDYIKEHPTCFYVTGHYLDREQGWHKVPEELPTFATWQQVDVVLYGKKTGTPWMEHNKWEAKDWTFRSIDDRRNTESVTVLAWKLSDQEGGTDAKTQNT